MTKEELMDEYEVMFEIEVSCGYDKWYSRGDMTDEEYREALDQFNKHWENRFREEGYDINEVF